MGLGWHLWSILRGIGFLFITYEVASLSLERLTGTRLSTRRRRGLRWSVGLAFLLADGLVKAAMLGPVRDGLYHNLLTAL